MDGALTGCQVLEGAAARLSIVRPALEPGRRPRSRGRRANETHRTRGPTGRTVGGGSLNGPNQRLSHVPSTSHQRRVLAPRRGDRAPLHDRYMRLSLPQGGWQFRRAVARGHRELETVSVGTPNRVRETTQNMATSMPSVVAACAAMGYLMSLSRYLDPYPVHVLFRGVSVSQ